MKSPYKSLQGVLASSPWSALLLYAATKVGTRGWE
jgi:hypothetical protein